MGKGISIYLGLNYSLTENLEYIKLAHKNGFTKIFTSFHIPEADYSKLVEEFKVIVNAAKKINMEVIADISPRGFEFLNLSLKDLKAVKNLGIDVLRIDFGFSVNDIAKFTQNPYGLGIEINASTVTEKFLKEFEEYGPNFDNLKACHNYYPRLNTGISTKSFIKKNEMLKKHGVKISAFVPSLINKRGPIYEGLPTLEIHRFVNPEISAKHLFALGIDNVFLGDSIPTDEEVENVGSIREDILEFRVKAFEGTNEEIEIINNLLEKDCYTNRSDSAADVVRAVESRLCVSNNTIKPFNMIERKKGYVTVDNEAYLRYMGELQICKKNLSRDERVNVIAFVEEEELFLLDFIDDETKFKFKIMK